MRGGSGETVTAPERPTRGLGGGLAGWPLVTSVVLAVFSLVPVFLVSALAPQIRADIAMTEGHLGIAVSAFFAASAVGNLGLGPVSDRFGGVRMIRLFSLPSTCALGYIAAGAHSWVTVSVALAVAGLANGGVQTAANAVLMHSIGAASQGLAFGMKQAAVPAATLLGGLAVPAVGITVGWRWGFAGAAVCSLLLGQFLPRATRSRYPGLRRGQARRSAASAATTTSAVGAVADQERMARRAGMPRLFTMAVGAVLSSWAANCIGAFFVLAATDAGVGEVTAGMLIILGGLSSLVVRVLAGYLGGRQRRGHVYGVAALVAVGTLGYLLMATMRPWLMAPAVVIAYGAGWGWMGLLAFAAARRFPLTPGWATGVVQSGAALGGSLGPLAFGFAVIRFGYQWAWTAVAAVNCVGAAVLVLAGRGAGDLPAAPVPATAPTGAPATTPTPSASPG